MGGGKPSQRSYLMWDEKISKMNKIPDSHSQHAELLARLGDAVGTDHLLISPDRTLAYRTGYRIGSGEALAVVRPATLVAMWRAAKACADHGAIIIVQAANTGLTGGSTPFGSYDRPVVLISTEMLQAVIPIANGNEVICLPGSTLTQLEDVIGAMGRSPHSKIGSSCIGASVVGGICNSSGGGLVRRGPAFTRYALFARIDGEGRLRLVNHLGRELGLEPEEILHRLDTGDTGSEATKLEGEAADVDDYSDVVRRSVPGPARFNANPNYLYEAAGCAGKLIVFAVRVPTFASPGRERSFAIGTHDPTAFAKLRRSMLTELRVLPSVCEYLNRDAVDAAVSHGRDICTLLALLGAKAMPRLAKFQKRLDGWGLKLGLGENTSARIAQLLFKATPHPLSGSLRSFVEVHDHVLFVTTDDQAIEPLARLLEASSANQPLDVRELDEAEAAAAFRVRFASAGAMVRMRDLQQHSGELATLDIALPRNSSEWLFKLPSYLQDQVAASAIYGHFICHVFHLDYLLKEGVGREEFELAVKSIVESRGGQMPAEHNFGHIYQAPPHVEAFYRALDPTNSLNPGVGKTSRKRDWR